MRAHDLVQKQYKYKCLELQVSLQQRIKKKCAYILSVS